MKVKAIIINGPSSPTPQTWLLDEDPNFKQMERFVKEGNEFEVRNIIPRELVLRPDGGYSLKTKTYHVMPV